MDIMPMENNFPANMSILVVDANREALTNLETLLHECQYHVTTTGKACEALDLLEKNKNKFDLVITEIHLPDMDGFTMLKLIGQKLNAPVTVLSSCDDKEVVKKCIIHGACEYLLKPARIEELKSIWQHVFRRKMLNPIQRKISYEVIDEQHKQPKIKTKHENIDENKKREEEQQMFGVYQPNKKKRPRLVWTDDLHKKFLQALELLGDNNIVPKKILELMNEENLTRENVASHLQKYRMYLANKKGERKVSQNRQISYPADPRVVQKSLMNNTSEDELNFYSSMQKNQSTRHQMQLNTLPPSGSSFPVLYNHSFATRHMFEGNQLPNYNSSTHDHPYPIPVGSNNILCQEISNGSFGLAGNLIEPRLPFANIGNFDVSASYFNNSNDFQWNE